MLTCGRVVETMTADFYELNTDEFYAYGYLGEDWASIRFEVILRETADPDVLQRALGLAFKRHPYFDTVLSTAESPGRLVLRPCEGPPAVFETDGFIPHGEPALCGRLIAVSCKGKTVRVRFSHALSDGAGARGFVQTMLVYYFRLRFEGADEETLRAEIAGADIPREYDNPFSYIRMPAYSYCVSPKRSFLFREDEVSENEKRSIRFSVPQDRLLRFAKSGESSVAAVASWLLMCAVFEVSGTDEPVTVSVPYDMRRLLGCEQSMRNCNTTLYLRMTRGFLKRDIGTQLTALRGSLYLQMDKGNAVPLMQRSYEEYLEASRCATAAEREAFYHRGGNLDLLPIVSCVGIFDLGPYERYYEKADSFVTVSGRAGFLMSVVSNKGRFLFNLTSTVKEWEKYLAVMLRVLGENGIPAEKTVIVPIRDS